MRPLPLLLPVGGSRARRRVLAVLLSLHDLAGGTGVSRAGPDGVVFHEAQVDDARLTPAVLRTAVLDHGAVAANHCAVVGIEHGRGGRAPGGLLDDGTLVEVRSVVMPQARGQGA